MHCAVVIFLEATNEYWFIAEWLLLEERTLTARRPTSGMGVTKVLRDVDALGQYVPEWLQTAGVGIEKISDFYRDPGKCACDERSIRLARRWRELSTNTSYL